MLWINFGIWFMYFGCIFKKGFLIEIEYIMKWIVIWFECLEMDVLKGNVLRFLRGEKDVLMGKCLVYNMFFFSFCCDWLEVV